MRDFCFEKLGTEIMSSFDFVKDNECHLSIRITLILNLTSAVMFCSFLLLLEAVGNV